MDEPRKIIALRSGALGDCVVSTPALRLLRRRFPEAEITVVGDPYSIRVLEGSPFFDRTIALSHWTMPKLDYLRALIALRREKPDLLIAFNSSGRSRIQTAIIGGRRRLGFDRGHW